MDDRVGNYVATSTAVSNVSHMVASVGNYLPNNTALVDYGFPNRTHPLIKEHVVIAGDVSR